MGTLACGLADCTSHARGKLPGVGLLGFCWNMQKFPGELELLRKLMV